MGRGYAPAVSENWGTSSDIKDQTPGISRTLAPWASKTIGSLGLGKAGMFGVPYLTAGLIGAGILGKSLGLFKRRRSVDPYAEITGMAREGEAEANRYAGELGSLGMDLQTGGRAMLERGRSGYLDALMNPNVAMGERAALASQLGAASRGVGPMVGLLGGPGAAAAYARNASQYNPALASGLTQIGSNALNRRAQGYQSMAGFGQQDFGQGLGLRGQGFNIGQQGRQNLMGVLRQNEQMRQAQRAQQQAGFNSLIGGLGSGLGSGLFK
jgi:hypothetical protein